MKEIRSILIMGLTLLASTAVATTIHVPSEQPTIQAGVDAASDGDTVLVADGIYTGDGNRDIDFGGKNLVLRSENGPAFTIIDCEGSSEDRHRGFYFHSGEDSTSVVDGFTIQGGYAQGACHSMGGGIYIGSSSPTIVNCWLKDNTASGWGSVADGLGGGVYCLNSSSAFIHCVFIGNDASAAGGMSWRCGGGIACEGSSPRLINCTFVRNHAQGGSAVSCFDSSPELLNCNIAFGLWGAGVYCDYYDICNASLHSCNIYGNEGGDWFDCIADQAGVNGNFSADPLFCDTAAGNCRLAYASPCMPYNSPCGQLVGALPAPCEPCCAERGDIDHDGLSPDVSDLVHLSTYMFQEGPELPCPEEADINGDWTGPDIADLVYLVTYMFQDGPPPAVCP